MWTDNLDRIYLINLPSRPDRLAQSEEELKKHAIPYTVFPAIQNENGAYGLLLTMEKLFTEAELLGLNNILVLEDDVTFTQDSLIGIMNNIMRQVEKMPYDLLYLGANVDGPLHEVEDSSRLLQCSSMYSSHAIAYSEKGWIRCLEQLKKQLEKILNKEYGLAYDQMLWRHIQRDGKCFVTNPFIAVQRPGYSDIENRETDYSNHFKNKFQKELRKLRGI